MISKLHYHHLVSDLSDKNVKLVAVSKNRSIEEIKKLYDFGQRDFGENYVQELLEKYEKLPKDINWHFIGHLQTNKVKYIAPFISTIQSVDSLKLFLEINKQAKKYGRVVDCFIEIKIAKETTKTGMYFSDAQNMLQSAHIDQLGYVQIVGVMGIATFTKDTNQILSEFGQLKAYFINLQKDFPPHSDSFKELSMGMSQDYELAIEVGSNIVRLGSLLFS